jgi:hypothetical protein
MTISLTQPKEPQKTCIFYIGVAHDHNDLSGEGTCLDNYDGNGEPAKCKDVIAAGKCSKGRSTPILDDKPVICRDCTKPACNHNPDICIQDTLTELDYMKFHEQREYERL